MGWLDNPWGHWFSVYAKYSEKLTFLTLIRAGVRNTTFSKKIVYILNGLFPSASSLNYVNILCASGKQLSAIAASSIIQYSRASILMYPQELCRNSSF